MTSSNCFWKLGDFIAHGGDVRCVSLGQKSGRVLATGGNDNKVNMWAVGKPNCIMSLSGHTAAVESIRFSQNENLIVAGAANGALRIWDLEAAKIMRVLSGHKGSVTAVEFHPIGEFAVTGSADNNVKLWDLRRKGCINTYKGHTSQVNVVRFSPDGKWMVSGSEDSSIKLWDLVKGKLLAEFKSHSAAVTSIEFHPTDLLLASGSKDGCVKVWDLDKLSEMASSQNTVPEPIRSVLFHTDGICLYGATDNELKVYGCERADKLDTVNTGWKTVSDLALANNQLISTGFTQNTISTFIVDIQKLQPLCGGSRSSKANSSGSSSGRRTFVAGQLPLPAEKVSKKPEEIGGGDDGVSHAVIQDEESYKQMFSPQKNPGYQKYSSPFQSPADSENRERGKVRQHPDNRDNAAAVFGSKMSDVEVLSSIGQGHESVKELLSNRLRHLKVVQHEWKTSGIKSAVDVAVGLKDHSLIADLLLVLLSRVSYWNLDVCNSILPVLSELVNSKYERYVHVSLSTLRLVLQTFGSMIKSNLAPPVAIGVDISKDERALKCRHCHRVLMNIRFDLRQKVGSQQGRLAQKMKEILMLTDQLE